MALPYNVLMSLSLYSSSLENLLYLILRIGFFSSIAIFLVFGSSLMVSGADAFIMFQKIFKLQNISRSLNIKAVDNTYNFKIFKIGIQIFYRKSIKTSAFTLLKTVIYKFFILLISKKMLDQHSFQGKPPKVNLILVQPSYKLSHEFAQLRNELDRNDIKYMSMIGYDEVKQLMKDKLNRNLIVINSSNMMRNQFPKQIFNAYGNQIYFYPNRYENYGFLQNVNNVVDLYRTATGSGPVSRGINLRSIKKDIQRSRQKRQYQQFYDKIMVMHPKGYNPQYDQLFNILQGFKNKVQPISRQNQAHYHKQGKALLVLQRQAFDSVNKFIIDNRQQNNIDLAILGYVKGFIDKKNYAIMTDHPSQIIEYLDEAGLSLPGAKQKLSMGSRSLGVQRSSSLNKQQTGMFMNADGIDEPSFAPNGIQQKNQYTHPIKVYEGDMINSNHRTENVNNNNDYNVTYEKPSDPTNQIPINSKLSQGSNKKPKKIKKLGGLTNSVASSGVKSQANSNDGVPPVINIHTVDSQAQSEQKIVLKDQIHFDGRDSQKIINGHMVNSIPLNKIPPLPPAVPNVNQNNVNANANANVNGYSNQAQNQGQNQGQFILNQADTNRVTQKPIMHWNLYPDKNRKSQFMNGPLFILRSQNENMSVGPNSSPSLKLVQSQNNINAKLPAVPVIAPVPEIVTYNNQSMSSNGRSNPSSVPPKPPAYRSRQSISQQSDFNSSSKSIKDYEDNQKRLRIQQKYNKGNQIRQLSQQYRGSNLSFPVDQNSQRIGIYSNSNNSRDALREQSPASPTDYYYSQFRPKGGQNPNKPLQIKRSTSLQDKPDIPAQLNNALIRNSQVVTNKKIPTSQQQIQRAQYQNKYANVNTNVNTNMNTSNNNSSNRIQTAQSIQTNNNTNTNINNTNTYTVQPRIIKHSIQVPQTYYQQQTHKTINTQKQIYNSNIRATQPTITQDISNITRITNNVNNNNNNVATTSVYVPTNARLYNNNSNNAPATATMTVNPTANPAYSGINSKINQTMSSPRSTTGVVQNPVYSAINSKLNETLSSKAPVTSNPVYSPINKVVSNYLSNTNIAPATANITTNITTNNNNTYTPYNTTSSSYTLPTPTTTPTTNPTDNPKYQAINRTINTIISNNAPVTSNPAYASINSTINNKLGSDQLKRSSSSGALYNNNVYESTGIIRHGGGRPGYDHYNTATTDNTNTNTNNYNSINSNSIGIKPKEITTVNTYTATTTINTGNTTTNNNNASTSMKNYMQNLGISQQKYDIIQGPDGSKVYRLKSTYMNNKNNQILDRYKSAPKTTSQTVPPTSPRQNVFNWEQYDEHIDQRGRKYYTLKKMAPSTITTGNVVSNTINTVTAANNITNSNRASITPYKAQTPHSMQTQQTPNSQQQLLIQSKSASRIEYNTNTNTNNTNNTNTNNTNMYTSTTSPAIANQYNSYNSPVAVQTTTSDSRNINTNTTTKKQQPPSSSARYSSYTSPVSINSPTATNYNSATNIYNPYAYTPTNNNNTVASTKQIITTTNQTRNYISPTSIPTPTSTSMYNSNSNNNNNNNNQRDSLYNNAPSVQNYNNYNTLPAGNSKIVANQLGDGQVKVMEDHEKGTTPTGKHYQVNKRYSVTPQSVTKQIKLKQQGPNSLKQVYQVQTKMQSSGIGAGGAMYEKNMYNRVQQNKYQYVQTKSKSSRPSIQSRTYNAPALTTASKKQSQFSNQYNQGDDTSQMSRDSLMTDSRPSMSKIFNTNLYGQNKPYLVGAGNMKIQSSSDLSRIYQDLKNLKTSNNFTHFIIDTSHPQRSHISDYAGVQDKIVQIDFPEKVYEYMLKKPLPNQFYDIGLIFLNASNKGQISPSSIIQGYYIVDVNPSNPSVQIKKQKKTIYINNLDNIQIIKKLLLAPSIQHYIFYPRGSDNQISKMLNLFPSTKFQKFNYGNKMQLQNLLNMHLKNKGRLMRVLIFVNSNNIRQIQPVLDSNLNHKTFTMICTSPDDRLRDQYKRVKFSNNFDFGSYGSVMNMASLQSKSFMGSPQQNMDISHHANDYNTNNYNNGYHETKSYDTRNQQPMIYSTNQGGRPKIYIQRPHAGIDKQIERNFPGAYDIKFFNNASEIKQKSRDNFILLHRDADNVGSQFDRNLGTLILLGGKKGDRIPSGSVNIPTMSQLVKNIL